MQRGKGLGVVEEVGVVEVVQLGSGMGVVEDVDAEETGLGRGG